MMLEVEQDITVVGTAGSIADVRASTLGVESPPQCDVAIVDLDLPDGSGLGLIPDLREANSNVAILVLTATVDRLEVARAIEAGVGGVIHKTAGFHDIVAAIRVLAGGGHLHAIDEVLELLRLMRHQREQEHVSGIALARLTSREREVLGLLAEGLGDRQIAERLTIGVDTVHSHVTAILSKLGVESRLQAVIFAIKHGLIQV